MQSSKNSGSEGFFIPKTLEETSHLTVTNGYQIKALSHRHMHTN